MPKPPAIPAVNQSKSEVGGDQVAGHKISAASVSIYSADRAATVIGQLLEALQVEMDKDERCAELKTNLQRYHSGVVKGGVVGLEEKLKTAGRHAEIEDAIEQKERFVMLLEKWSYYASAQEIIIYLLARAEHRFNSEVRPILGSSDQVAVNSRINALIVDPTVDDCGATVLNIDHLTAMGMFYWLAEQCFVRWHP